MDIKALEARRAACFICGKSLPKGRRKFCPECRKPLTPSVPFCAGCGGPLPKGRLKYCHSCKPPKTRTPPPEPLPTAPYTIEDRNAQALARGMQYGQFMGYVLAGLPLPKRRRPVIWPKGSEHEGEEQSIETGGRR